MIRLKVIVITIGVALPNFVLGRSVKNVFLQEHNRHRNNAGLKHLYWDSYLERKAREAAKSNCTDHSHSLEHELPDDNYFYFRNSTHIQDYSLFAKKAFADFYKEGRGLFEYPGYLSTESCEVSSEAMTNNKNAWWFLVLVMNQNTLSVGCDVFDCSEHEKYYFLCLYRVSLPKNATREEKARLFPGKNFYEVCSSEVGWGSCHHELNWQCRKRESQNDGSELNLTCQAPQLKSMILNLFFSLALLVLL